MSTLPSQKIFFASGFTDRDCDLVTKWWESSRVGKESLPSTLTRLGIFRDTAERTIDLVNKGFVRDIHPGSFFENDGIDRLRDTVLQFHKTANEPKTAKIEKLPISSHRTTQSASGNAWETHCDFDAQTPAPKKLPSVGDRVGRCIITGILGKGGFGTVYSALHTTLNIPVAIKVLFNEARLPDEIRELLRREAQVLARINHASIVRVLDFDDSESPYFIMEMIDGPSLLDLLQQTGTFNESRCIEIMIQIVSGLSEAWKLGLVHRDIKPGNILLTKTGEAKLADLGLAKMPGFDDSSLTPNPNRPIGTCAYIAPEQVKSCNKLDFRADIYSLGCTMYHILSGKIPFEGKSQREVIMKHMTADAPPLSDVMPQNVSAGLSAIIARMMQKNPDDRFASYDELLITLSDVLTEKTNLSAKTKSDLKLIKSSQLDSRAKGGNKSRILKWFGR